ncbi:MAG: hypothetical protein HQL52_13215 [Magnetococcales bacterium]|nr:hypothetical protein [Magnetococcales bacterium]
MQWIFPRRLWQGICATPLHIYITILTLIGLYVGVFGGLIDWLVKITWEGLLLDIPGGLWLLVDHLIVWIVGSILIAWSFISISLFRLIREMPFRSEK